MRCLRRIIGGGAARELGSRRRRGVLGACSGPASDGFSLSHKIWLCALAALLGLARPAAANDSAASLGAGGLTLERAADVAMAVEQLEIRRDLVRVRYVFVNRGPAEISTIVAFPLPDVGPDYLEDADFGPRADPVNFVGFTVTVDGRRVTPRAELRAFVGAREVTGLLRALHVPVSLFDARLPPALERLAPAARARLDAAHALNGGSPAWRMQARLYWEQRFPPGQPVAVEHRYRPIAGGTFWLARELRGQGVEGARRPPYCLDPAARARVAALDPERPVWVGHVDYILTTARNWAGPIGDFELIADSGDPEFVATACIDPVPQASVPQASVRRVSAQRIEARLADFAPARELVVGFIGLPQDDAPAAASSASVRALTAQDLAALSRAQLRMMRNEIYARHGMIFRSEALRRYFTAQPWYQPRHDDVTAMLTPVERANVALIQEREQALAR
jgi:hypothetical protein